MPNFQKSKGFQLRSGNKAKAPFKMMGSSPVHYEVNPKDLAARKDKEAKANEESAKAKSIETKNAAEAKIAKEKNDAANKSAADKAAKDKEAKASRGWEEKKEANKAEKKENRGTRKDFKKGNKEEIAELKESGADRKTVRAAKKENRQEQKDLKQSHRDDSKANKKDYKSGDDYKAHKAAKKEAFAQGMRDAGEIVSNIGNTNPKESMSSIIQGQADRKTNKVNKDIQNEKDRVNTARTQQLVDATDKAGTEGEKVSSTKSEAVTNGGNANVTVKTSNNKGSVTTSKTLAKK